MSRFGTDLLRIISVTFIIFNHVSWPFYARNGSASQMPMDMAVAFINQLGKPSVLIFIFLSGLAFARHRINSEFRAMTFYQNRAWRILPPYLLASFIGIYFFNTIEFTEILPAFFTGGAMYHLYFIAVISYCYLLFPLLRQIPSTLKNVTLYLAGFFTLHFFMALFFPKSTNPELTLFLKNLFAITYAPELPDAVLNWIDFMSFAILFFQAGIWIGRRKDALKERKPSFYISIASLMFLAFITEFIDFFFRLDAGVHADISGRVWRMTVFLYAATWIYLLRNIKKDTNPFMRRLARASFLVYLFHPFLINLTKPFGYTFPVLHAILIIAASWALSILLQEIALRFHVAGFLLGEGDKLSEKRANSVNLPQQA